MYSTWCLQVQRVWLAPGYNKTTYLNDIALLQLANPLNATSYVNGIPLPQSYANFSETSCQLVGLGFNATSCMKFFSHVILVLFAILVRMFIIHIVKILQAIELYSSMNVYSYSAADSLNATCYGAYLQKSVAMQPNQMCGILETGNENACHGDTGSPLVCSALSSNGSNSKHNPYSIMQFLYFILQLLCS